jgi:hypothetical protein
MPAFYDDSKYGVIERFNFRAHQTNLVMSGDTTLLRRHYPKGPIFIKKIGVRHLATQGGTEITCKFLLDDTVTLATIIASTDSSPWAIASKAVNHKCSAGSYINASALGTVATGSVECFMDYVRYYNSNWDH